jgi:hypothetical protein
MQPPRRRGERQGVRCKVDFDARGRFETLSLTQVYAVAEEN